MKRMMSVFLTIIMASCAIAGVMSVSAAANSASPSNANWAVSLEEPPVYTGEEPVVEDVLRYDSTANSLENIVPPAKLNGCDVPGTREADGVKEIGYSEDFSVSVGTSWEEAFNLDKLFDVAHDVLKVTVSDVSDGTYKLIIVDEAGATYSTSELTGDRTVTITGAEANSSYTVYVVNTGTATVTGHITISV